MKQLFDSKDLPMVQQWRLTYRHTWLSDIDCSGFDIATDSPRLIGVRNVLGTFDSDDFDVHEDAFLKLLAPSIDVLKKSLLSYTALLERSKMSTV
jgi:hypothetical protein